MPSPTLRKAIWALLAIFVIGVLVVVTLPLIASTQIVRYRIAQEMESLTGYRVTLGTAPEIRVWPSFHGVLRNVTLSDWGSEAQTPVVQADRVDVDLSAIRALVGRVSFSSARFLRPVIHVVPQGGLYLPVSPGGGKIVSAIKVAEGIVTANPAKPDVASLPSQSLGTIDISDGRIVLDDKGKEEEIASKLKGEISWPALDRSGTVSMKGLWRGRSFDVDFSLGEPLLLFASGNSDLTLSLESDLLTASFKGIANLTQKSYVDGELKMTAPSLRSALQWGGSGMAAGAPVGSLSVTSHISGNERRLKLDQAEIALDQNPGTGVVEISTTGAVPAVSGTLAFDTLDLESFLTAFTPLVPGTKSDPGGAKMTNKVDVDLRFSVAKASAGPISLSNVAATAQVRGGLSVFDISDSTAFEGSAQAGLHIENRPDGRHVELRFLATDIDLAELFDALGIKRLVPEAKGTISFMLKGMGENWQRIIEDGEGRASAKLGQGRIDGLSLPDFMKKAGGGGFFALKDVSDGSFKITKAGFNAKIADGIARIDEATATGADGSLSLVGIIPYIGGGLALSGSAKGPDNKTNASFFLGGSWNAPFVAPAIPSLTPQ